MKKLNLCELKVKSKSGKSKTQKRRKPRKFFSEFSSSKFSILKRKSRKKNSEVFNVSEFSTWPNIISFTRICQRFVSFEDQLFFITPLSIYSKQIVSFNKLVNIKQNNCIHMDMIPSFKCYRKKNLRSILLFNEKFE